MLKTISVLEERYSFFKKNFKKKLPYITIFLDTFYTEDFPKFLGDNIYLLKALIFSLVVSGIFIGVLLEDCFRNRLRGYIPSLKLDYWSDLHVYKVIGPVELILVTLVSFYCLYHYFTGGQSFMSPGYLSHYILYKSLFYLAKLDDKK